MMDGFIATVSHDVEAFAIKPLVFQKKYTSMYANSGRREKSASGLQQRQREKKKIQELTIRPGRV